MQSIPAEPFDESLIDPALLQDDTSREFPQSADPNASPPNDHQIDPHLRLPRGPPAIPQRPRPVQQIQCHLHHPSSGRPLSGLSSYALSLLCHDVPLSPDSQTLAMQYGTALSGLPLNPHRGSHRQSQAIERSHGGVPQAQRELLTHVHTLPGNQFAHLHQSINRYAPALHGRWSQSEDDVFGANGGELPTNRQRSFSTPKKRDSTASFESTPTKKRRESVGSAVFDQTEEMASAGTINTPILTLASLEDFSETPSSRDSPTRSSTAFSPVLGEKIRKPEALLRVNMEASPSPQDRNTYRKRVRPASAAPLPESGAAKSLQVFATPATVDITSIDFDVTAEELLTFFPLHTKWPHYMYRLVQNGWEIPHIAGFINMVRSLEPPDAIKRNTVGKHLGSADKELLGKKVGARTKKRSQERVEDFTAASWSPPDIRGGLEDYFITSLAQGVVIFPAGCAARLLTKTILHAVHMGHDDAKLSEINNYIAQQGLNQMFPEMVKGDKTEDRIALGRHAKAIIRDEERVKQIAESKLAEAVSKGQDERGLKSYLSRRVSKATKNTDEGDDAEPEQAATREQ